MSPDEIRLDRRMVLLGPVCLAACGFAPVQTPRGPGDRLRGRLAVSAPDTADGFRLRSALEDRLGPAGSDAAMLTVETEVEAIESGVLPDGSAARERLDAHAQWQLAAASGAVLAQGEERAHLGASITGPAVSVRTAQSDARERVMAVLADRIVAQLLLLPPEALP